MSKSSKSCGYTGHMKVMNRVNETKADYKSNRSKSHEAQQFAGQGHLKHKADYPEVAAELRAQAKCNCKN